MANCLKSRIYIRLEPPDWEALWYLGCDPEVIRMRLERMTVCLEGRCSIQLSYRTIGRRFLRFPDAKLGVFTHFAKFVRRVI